MNYLLKWLNDNYNTDSRQKPAGEKMTGLNVLCADEHQHSIISNSNHFFVAEFFLVCIFVLRSKTMKRPEWQEAWRDFYHFKATCWTLLTTRHVEPVLLIENYSTVNVWVDKISTDLTVVHIHWSCQQGAFSDDEKKPSTYSVIFPLLLDLHISAHCNESRCSLQDASHPTQIFLK